MSVQRQSDALDLREGIAKMARKEMLLEPQRFGCVVELEHVRRAVVED